MNAYHSSNTRFTCRKRDCLVERETVSTNPLQMDTPHASAAYSMPSRILFPTLDREGTVLPVVLIFSTIGLMIVFTYISHQLIIAKPNLNSLSSVQALFNARSGVYKAFDMLVHNTPVTDTLPSINLFDSDFGSDMFEDSKVPSNPFGGVPSDLTIYTNDSFGDCQITLTPKGSFYELTAIGRFRGSERKVAARLGGKLPALPDTVLIIYNQLTWEGNEPRGTRVMRTVNPPSTNKSELLESIVSEYELLLQVFDSAFLDPPLVIQSNRDIDKIPDTINGSLLIDGQTTEIEWSEKRTIIVMGDLQVTGEVTIEEVSFIVGGEIKFFDNSIIRRSSIFSKNRIFIGDYAQFNGDALATNSITVYKDASIVDKSTLVVSGRLSSGQSSDSSEQSSSSKFSFYIEDNASVDAVCLALGTPGAIRTGAKTKIAGILWAQNTICHQGSMNGLIRAGKMIDCSIPEVSELSPLTGTPQNKGKDKKPTVSPEQNRMTGDLAPLSTIREYRMPCFTEELLIIGWKEE